MSSEKSDSRFRPGDVVKLKSGGPEMTVESVGKNATSGAAVIQCTWFDAGKYNNQAFVPEALQFAKNDVRWRS